MKSYTITVNGTAYDVTVEENVNGAAPVASTPAPAPKAAPAPAPVKEAAPAKKAAPAGEAGSVEIAAPMPGKILDVKAGVGQAVKKGDVILLLEAMKMENEVVAPQDGTIASINASAGDMVEAGSVLATMN